MDKLNELLKNRFMEISMMGNITNYEDIAKKTEQEIKEFGYAKIDETVIEEEIKENINSQYLGGNPPPDAAEKERARILGIIGEEIKKLNMEIIRCSRTIRCEYCKERRDKIEALEDLKQKIEGGEK